MVTVKLEPKYLTPSQEFTEIGAMSSRQLCLTSLFVFPKQCQRGHRVCVVLIHYFCLFALYLLFFLSRKSVSMSGPVHPGTHCVDQVALTHRDMSASAF